MNREWFDTLDYDTIRGGIKELYRWFWRRGTTIDPTNECWGWMLNRPKE